MHTAQQDGAARHMPRRFLANRSHLKSRLEELSKELHQHAEV